MDNARSEVPELPGTSEIVIHNGRIALERARQPVRCFSTFRHEHASPPPPPPTAAAAARPLHPRDVKLYFGNDAQRTGQGRAESVVYSQRGDSQVVSFDQGNTQNYQGGINQNKQGSTQNRQGSAPNRQSNTPNRQGVMNQINQGSTQNRQCITRNHPGSHQTSQGGTIIHQGSTPNRQGSTQTPGSSVGVTGAIAGAIDVKRKTVKDRNARPTNVTRTHVNAPEANQSSSYGNAITRVRVGGSTSQASVFQYIDPANRKTCTTDNTYTPLPSVTKINVRTFNSKSYDDSFQEQDQHSFESQREQRSGNGTGVHEENGALKSVPESNQKSGGPYGSEFLGELQNVIRNRGQHKEGIGAMEHLDRRHPANVDGVRTFPSIIGEYDVIGGDKSSFDGYDRIGSVATFKEGHELDEESDRPMRNVRTCVGIYSEIEDVKTLVGRRSVQIENSDIEAQGDKKVPRESNEYATVHNAEGGFVETLPVHHEGIVENSDTRLALKGLRGEDTNSNHKGNRYTVTNPHPGRNLKNDVGQRPDNNNDTERGKERVNVLGNGGDGQISAMERVKSWVVSQDDADETTGNDSTIGFDRHSIAEMPIKMVAEAGRQELKAEDAVLTDEQRGVEDVVSHPRGIIADREHLDGETAGNEARRVHISLDENRTETFAGNHSISGVLSDQVISEDVRIEMADMDSGHADARFPRSTMQHPDGNTFDRSLLDGWTPSSPYAHHLQRNPSVLSEGSQPHGTGKGKVRQLSLAIGEEWEDMTGHTPVVSPDVERAFSYRSHRRIHSCDSDGHQFFGRNFWYMSHPPRLESNYRRNRHPEDQNDDAVVKPPSPVPTAMEEDTPEEKKPTPEEQVDQKRWLRPNPYNKINQRFHSTLQCPCCLFFCFLCCVPAVYLMQESDKEFDHGSKEKARKLGKKATVLYVIGSICSIIFLTATVLLVVIYLQAYLMRK